MKSFKEAWTVELIGGVTHILYNHAYVFVQKELCTINCVAYANGEGCWRLKIEMLTQLETVLQFRQSRGNQTEETNKPYLISPLSA
jgi:hypothetical protein